MVQRRFPADTREGAERFRDCGSFTRQAGLTATRSTHGLLAGIRRAWLAGIRRAWLAGIRRAWFVRRSNGVEA
jgi:hypothetical protein